MLSSSRKALVAAACCAGFLAAAHSASANVVPVLDFANYDPATDTGNPGFATAVGSVTASSFVAIGSPGHSFRYVVFNQPSA
jgi:hypothetical protein